MIVECIQGVGGIRLATAEFMQGVRQACDETDTVLICDEIQCGYGRSGKFFAHQHLGVKPDLITVAKGIGNGFPMGAVLISPKFTPVYGQLGTTFGGNHLACAAALAVLDIMEEEHLVEKCRQGRKFPDGRYKGFAPASCGGCQGARPDDRRGVGRALQGNQGTSCSLRSIVSRDAAVRTCWRLLPPLCLSEAEAADFLKRLERVVNN